MEETTISNDPRVLAALAEAEAGPPGQKLPPGEWVRKNLFNSWYNSLLTVVLIVPATVGLLLAIRFLLVTGRWEPVRANLELFMTGRYPREERWRLVVQYIGSAGAIGMAVGTARAAAASRARTAGVPDPSDSWRRIASNYWAVGLLLVVLLSLTRTVGPLLVAAGALGAALVGYQVASRLPDRLRTWSWTLAALIGVSTFQALTGTGGVAWLFTSVALLPALLSEVGRHEQWSTPISVGVALVAAVASLVWWSSGSRVFAVVFTLVALAAVGLAASGRRSNAVALGTVVITVTTARLLLGAIGLSGIDWANWGGYHINLVVATSAIVMAFPFGLLLALGRRSSLPGIRVLCTLYIEFFRGVPLITLLLSAQFFIGFFLDTDTPLSLLTRATVAFTIFTAAYVAEVVRGGLQSVSRGQIEAGQALGLSAPVIMQRIVLPQALRAVIPALVGTFISLFKDTSLLVIIGIPDVLGIREFVHAQPDFRGFGIAETLVFAAFAFWAIAFTMSRESQRLERKLGVGLR